MHQSHLVCPAPCPAPQTLQDDLEVYSKQREELEKEKAQAQSQLEQLDSEVGGALWEYISSRGGEGP